MNSNSYWIRTRNWVKNLKRSDAAETAQIEQPRARHRARWDRLLSEANFKRGTRKFWVG